MFTKGVKLIFGFFCFSTMLSAQSMVYTEPDRNDLRQTNFEIIGKIGNNVLIYKNLRDNHAMSVYDMNMKEIDRVAYDFMPARVINADFLAYADFSYMFYQYQRRSIVYCMAVKIDALGKVKGEPMMLDTTDINFGANDKIYSILPSEDKQRIAIIKINTKNDDRHLLTTVIYSKDLKLQKKSYINISMPERHDYLTEFQLDNDGNLVFARAVQSQQNENIQQLFLITKSAGSDTIVQKELALNGVYLDDLRIKADNYNKHYIITSFYRKSRQGNIDGLYVGIWNRQTDTLTGGIGMTFEEQLRNDAKGENSIKTAFNDYSVRNIIVKKDGGFLLAAEAFYTTGRGGLNRSNYFYGSPFSRQMDYYMFSPYSYGYPWYRYNGFNNTQLSRYHAENITVFSFGGDGKIIWNNIIPKSQWDDDTDAFIGYSLFNTGDQLHFLFNQQEKRLQLLSDQSIDPSGKIVRNPTLKNLDKGYEFMARYGKQVGNRQIIFPCLYRNYLCFARLEL